MSEASVEQSRGPCFKSKTLRKNFIYPVIVNIALEHSIILYEHMLSSHKKSIKYIRCKKRARRLKSVRPKVRAPKFDHLRFRDFRNFFVVIIQLQLLQPPNPPVRLANDPPFNIDCPNASMLSMENISPEKNVGAAWHRGSVCASHPAAPGLILRIFLKYYSLILLRLLDGTS